MRKDFLEELRRRARARTIDWEARRNEGRCEAAITTAPYIGWLEPERESGDRCRNVARQRVDGIEVCVKHVRAAEEGRVVVHASSRRRGRRTKCNLCRGKRVLLDDRGRRTPCLCTPEGIELANRR